MLIGVRPKMHLKFKYFAKKRERVLSVSFTIRMRFWYGCGLVSFIVTPYVIMCHGNAI